MKMIAVALFVLVSAMAIGQSSTWEYSTDNSGIDGKVKEIVISEGDRNSAALVVRCSNVCEVYLSTRREILDEQASVRVKFNNSPLKRFAVNRGSGDDSLFFHDPMGVLKAVRDNGGYMTIEFSPFEKTPVTSRFGIWNLPPTILARISKWEEGVGGRAKVKIRATLKAEIQTCSSGYANDVCDRLRTEAHSYHTEASCTAHGFHWEEVESDIQQRGCWIPREGD
jgi:hypothetical protein